MIVRNRATEFKYTHNFIEALFAEDMHAKRVYSLANATLGVMTSASLAVSTIGHGLALARRGLSKHALARIVAVFDRPLVSSDDAATEAWFSDLPMQWEKLAIELEKDFAKFAKNDATSEDLWRSVDEGKRLSKFLYRK
jgi:hypothetical protein